MKSTLHCTSENVEKSGEREEGKYNIIKYLVECFSSEINSTTPAMSIINSKITLMIQSPKSIHYHVFVLQHVT